ncbi:hypothetical protein SCP_0508390 [Sparassis crispa]|uniref:RRM domain-containing protein n=1 Tax=Sparassis crispa TaxID=139825 RepID=A0A401GNJ0_9APHY|nr:hypothetical protein SCP_0508390 [Sparassis crispa]GBE83783.1 hypothetical protein SCP_0508390 [Sparassis crispa]
MTSTPNPVFKFNRDTYTVKVENIVEYVSRHDIVELFSNLIGEVRKCEEHTEGSRRALFLTFHTNDAAKKALCMSGYNVAEVPLTVTASIAPDFPRVVKHSRQQDMRRNLYVLGLPFDLTKAEFVDLFSRYGTVSHAVILATVDNASRRRGFVVMSNHEEAKRAMDALSRTDIKGHQIDVSWAVVQRSQGFLDGGDRMTVLSSHSPSPSPPFDIGSVHSAPSSGAVSLATTPLPEQVPLPILSAHAAKILVTNLPAVIFSQTADLLPLLCPFGEIKSLEIVPCSSVDVTQGDISVVIEYATIAQAKEACDALHGQMYSNKPVKVEYLPPTGSDFNTGTGLSEDFAKTGLNPHAAPFMIPATLPPDAVLASVGPLYTEPNGQAHIAAAVPTGLLAVNSYHLSPYATSPSLYTHVYVPVAGTVRPNSAPSLWSGNPLQSRAGQWTFPHLQHLSNLSTPSLRSPYAA